MTSRCEEPIATIEAALDELLSTDPVFLTTVEKQHALTRVARLTARLEAFKLRVLAVADDVAEATGSRSAAGWLADQTRQAHGSVRSESALATALDARWGQVGAALATGTVNVAQARVVVGALDALPKSLDDSLRVKAESYLVAQAEHVRAPRAAPAGPRGAGASRPRDRRRGRVPAAARRGTPCPCGDPAVVHAPGDGSTDLHARLPDHVAYRLRTYLEAYTSPRRTPLGDVDTLPSPAAGVRRSARSWRTCPTPACRCMVVRRRR